MTNTNFCAEVVKGYMQTLSAGLKVIPSDNGCFLVTPFTKPDGEGIELEIETLPNGNILINDMGDTLGYLFVNGLTLSKSVMDRANFISKCHGVFIDSEILSIETKPEDAGKALHALIQTAIAVTDLIQLRRSTNTQRIRFDNQVKSIITQSDVDYVADYQVDGARENHTFRFYVNSNKNLLIQPITASKESIAHSLAERWAYRFYDVLRKNTNYSPIAVLDDGIDNSAARRIWTPYALAPIEEYAIPWSQKGKFAQLLAGSPS